MQEEKKFDDTLLKTLEIEAEKEKAQKKKKRKSLELRKEKSLGIVINSAETSKLI